MPRPSPSSFRQFLPWTFVAALALLSLGLAQLHFTSRAQIALQHDQQTLTELELRSARQQLEAERLINHRQIADTATQLAQLRQTPPLTSPLDALHLVTLAPPPDAASPAPRAVVLWSSATPDALLHVDHLPSLPSAQFYQLRLTDAAYPDFTDNTPFNTDAATRRLRLVFRPARPLTPTTQFSIIAPDTLTPLLTSE